MPTSNKTPHKTLIHNLLLRGKSITGIEALNKFGCFRCSARVLDLIKAGIPVQSRLVVKNKKRFAEYYLTPEYLQNHNQQINRNS